MVGVHRHYHSPKFLDFQIMIYNKNVQIANY